MPGTAPANADLCWTWRVTARALPRLDSQAREAFEGLEVFTWPIRVAL